MITQIYKKVSNYFDSVNMEYKMLLMHIKNYFTISMFTKFLAFISIPIFTRLLGPEGYGRISLFLSMVSIVSIVGTLGLDSSIKRFYFEDRSKIKEFLSSNLIVIFSLHCLIFGITLLLRDELTIIFGTEYNIILIGVAVGILHSYKNALYGYFQACQNSILISKISVLNGSITILISVVLVLVTNSYIGQVYGYLISALIINSYLLSKNKNLLLKYYNKNMVKYSFGIGIPLLFNQLAGYILIFSDRLIINKYYGLEATGIYSFAYNVAMIMEMLIFSINSAWVPMLFDKLQRNDDKDINKYFVVFLKVIFLAAFTIIIFSKEFTLLLSDERYLSSLSIIPIVIIGYIFKFLYSMFTHIEYFYKKTKVLATFSIIAAIINISLNLILVPVYGYIAAAYTTLFSYVILFILHYVYVNNYLNSKSYSLKGIFNWFSFLFLGLIISKVIDIVIDNNTINFSYRIILVFILTYFYFDKELKNVRKMFFKN